MVMAQTGHTHKITIFNRINVNKTKQNSGSLQMVSIRNGQTYSNCRNSKRNSSFYRNKNLIPKLIRPKHTHFWYEWKTLLSWVSCVSLFFVLLVTKIDIWTFCVCKFRCRCDVMKIQTSLKDRERSVKENFKLPFSFCCSFSLFNIRLKGIKGKFEFSM